jgi:hypothetical protein
MRRIRSHLTYANVMATLAVFLVLSGGTAVALSGTDTVQSDDLGPGSQVMAPDVAANAVNGSDVLNGSLGTADLAGSIPAARVFRASDQSIPSGVTTPLNFTGENYDTVSMHNNTTNNSRLTAPVKGIYAVNAAVQWVPNTTGVRYLQLASDAVGTVAVQREPGSSTDLTQEVSTQMRLQAGEYIEAKVLQTSGGPLNVDNTPGWSPRFSMTWLAPGP